MNKLYLYVTLKTCAPSLGPAAIMKKTRRSIQLLFTMAEQNVVILGKVGAGKKTIANHIVGKDIFQTESASDARDGFCHYKDLSTENTHYRILTIDTEGLDTGPCNPLPYIAQHFQTIHLIIFVTAKGRYTDESHNSFIRTVQSLHQRAKPFCALIITHCEGITNESRQEIIDGFEVGSRSSEVAALMGKKIYTVGLRDISKVEPSMKESYQKGIAEDEKAIRRLVKECTSSLSVQDLAVIQRDCWERFCVLCRGCWESVCAFCRACWESPFCALCYVCWEFICLCYRCCRATLSCFCRCCAKVSSFSRRCWERITYQRVG